jgi:hypothetical protein
MNGIHDMGGMQDMGANDAAAPGLDILISNISVVEPCQLTGRPPLSGELSAHVSDPVRFKIDL